ncbi:hypothetical protein L7F22_046712 [Adiantum nelumboides]|nr:hypothetical protein [Adiantum nelumboides]
MAPPITHWLRRAPLGSGSFGKVSLAINLDNGDFFAVKSIQSAGSATEQCALETEVRILKSLQSPRIVSFLGADFSSEGSTCARNLFLEYMDGGNLAESIKKSGGCMDEMRAQCYTRAIVEGLAYLHEQEIVHCDIKGQNILVGSCGVKIADFGAAKKLSSDTPTHEFKGTPLWMAPEVVRGEEQGCASDVWSLGCTVVEMLQGRPPWGECCRDSSSAMSYVAAALFKIGYSTENPSLPEAISAGCRDFLSKTLQRDPKLRWSASQLLDHPWLQGAQSYESYCAQPSPRSAFDFPESGSDEDDEQDTWGSFPLCASPLPVACRKPSDGSIDSSFSVAIASIHKDHDLDESKACVCDVDNVRIPEECDWIMVRCADTDMSCGPKSFMREHIGMQVLRRGEGVNLSSLAFLGQRRSSR